MSEETTDDTTKASGTASGEELRGAAGRTAPPAPSDRDEDAIAKGEEKLEQAGGGH